MHFGLIGAGCIGRLRAEALRKIPGAKLVVVTEIDQQQAARVAALVRGRVCKDVAELLVVNQIEAIFVFGRGDAHRPCVAPVRDRRKIQVRSQ